MPLPPRVGRGGLGGDGRGRPPPLKSRAKDSFRGPLGRWARV